jgi:hypothetical protein
MPVVTTQRGLQIRLFASQNRRLLRRLRGFWGPDEGDEGAEGDVSSALQAHSPKSMLLCCAII